MSSRRSILAGLILAMLPAAAHAQFGLRGGVNLTKFVGSDAENVEAMQRLATLLEKLNRNAEASRLWQKIWQMHQAKPTTKRRWLREGGHMGSHGKEYMWNWG